MPERQFAVDLARDRIFPAIDRVTINGLAFINEAPLPEDLEKAFGLSLPTLDDFLIVDTKGDTVVCCEFLQLFPGMIAVLLQMYLGLLDGILQILLHFVSIDSPVSFSGVPLTVVEEEEVVEFWA